MFFCAFSVTKKGRNWLLLSETSAPHILRASYAAVWLRCGKFLISDPGASLYGILPHFGLLQIGGIHKKIDFLKQQPESDFGVCMLSGRLG